ncbi:MAG: DUF2306 domain-containing protein [Pseudomonadota bacterium]
MESPPARPSKRLTALIALALLLALPFVAHSVTQGVDGLNGVEQREPTRFRHPDALLSNLGIFTHMIFGGVITVLALLQAVPHIRTRWPKLHRISGRITVVGALLTALGGLIYIATQGTIGGVGMNAGFTLYGLLLAAAATMTYRTARARNRAAHRRWGLRLVWLAIGSWLYRVQYGLWYALTGGAGSTEAFTGPFDQVMFVGFFLPHLLLLELYLRRDVEPVPRHG